MVYRDKAGIPLFLFCIAALAATISLSGCGAARHEAIPEESPLNRDWQQIRQDFQTRRDSLPQPVVGMLEFQICYVAECSDRRLLAEDIDLSADNARVWREWTESYLKSHRDNNAARYLAADAAMREGNYDVAITGFSRVIERDPDFAAAFSGRGRSFALSGQPARAVTDYTRALEINPSDARALNGRGSAYLDLQQPDRALEDYAAAIDLNPNFVAAYFNRAIIHKSRGDYDLAIADYTYAMTVRPGYARAYVNRGLLYQEKGMNDAARADFSSAIASDSTYVTAWFSRAALLSKIGRPDDAVRDYSAVIALDSDNADAYYNRGFIYDQQEQYAEAIADYSKAIELRPDFFRAYNNRGVAYSTIGDYDRAIADFNELLRIDAQNAMAYYNLGSNRDMTGDHTDAISDYSAAIQISLRTARDAFYGRGLAHASRAAAKESAFELVQAVEDYDRALQLDSTFASVYYSKALACEKLGRTADAVSAYSSYLLYAPPEQQEYVDLARKRIRELNAQ